MLRARTSVPPPVVPSTDEVEDGLKPEAGLAGELDQVVPSTDQVEGGLKRRRLIDGQHAGVVPSTNEVVEGRVETRRTTISGPAWSGPLHRRGGGWVETRWWRRTSRRSWVPSTDWVEGTIRIRVRAAPNRGQGRVRPAR